MALVREAIPYVMSDYDGTIARTSEAPIDGVGVSEAYRLAIADMFGDEAAQFFQEDGGHQNRAPIEIIQSIASHMPIDMTLLKRYASQLTGKKLDILLPQIGKLNPDGSVWPRPTDGFVEFWTALSELKRRTIGTAVISAGHTDFITTWFEKFALEEPDAMVTAEVIDNLSLKVGPGEKHKPAPLPLRMAHAALDVKYGKDSINHVYYIGDSEEKDGGLAANTDSDFTLVDETDAAPAWRLLGEKLRLPGYEGGDAA